MEASVITESLCRKCKRHLPVENFNRNSRNKNGLNTRCKECVLEAYSPEERWVTGVMHNARKRAEAAGQEFSLTREFLLEAMPDKCPILGVDFVYRQGPGPNKYSPSLDRIDPGKGYTPDNVWIISAKANRIKSDATLEELEMVVRALRGLE